MRGGHRTGRLIRRFLNGIRDPAEVWPLREVVQPPGSAPDYVAVDPPAFYTLATPSFVTTPSYTNGHSVRFNSVASVDDHVEYGDVSDFDSITKFTVVGWLKFVNAPTTTEHIFAKGGPSAGRILSIATGSAGTGLDVNIAPTLGVTTVQNRYTDFFTIGGWRHWGVVYDGTLVDNARIAAYAQGAFQTPSSTPAVPPASTVSGGTAALVIADTSAVITHDRYFDEIAVWIGVAASAAQMSEIYNGGVAHDLRYVSLGTPTHYWRFTGDYTDLGSSPVTGTPEGNVSFSTTEFP